MSEQTETAAPTRHVLMTLGMMFESRRLPHHVDLDAEAPFFGCTDSERGRLVDAVGGAPKARAALAALYDTGKSRDAISELYTVADAMDSRGILAQLGAEHERHWRAIGKPLRDIPDHILLEKYGRRPGRQSGTHWRLRRRIRMLLLARGMAPLAIALVETAWLKPADGLGAVLKIPGARALGACLMRPELTADGVAGFLEKAFQGVRDAKRGMAGESRPIRFFREVAPT